ncbi:MAG: hypothetical protein ACJ74H_20655 [Thermoanaerobaculia bacterium]
MRKERRRPAPADVTASRAVTQRPRAAARDAAGISRRGTPALLLIALAFPAAAQTDTIVAGVVGDSSVVAPVVSWNRMQANGGNVSIALQGWTISSEMKRRRVIASLAITPLNAYAGDRAEPEFEASSIEATFGRADAIGERWLSDIRAVALYDRIEGANATYAGLRTRQTWRRIVAEDPLLMTFEGFEVSALAEVLAGSRVKIDQRLSRRWGRVRAGESVTAFYGRSLERGHEFLIGMWGYRYAELRLDRGVAANIDASYPVTPKFAIGAHVGALRSRDLDARGVALDMTASWKAIGIRFGAARADGDDRDVVFYGSVLAARFLR